MLRYTFSTWHWGTPPYRTKYSRFNCLVVFDTTQSIELETALSVARSYFDLPSPHPATCRKVSRLGCEMWEITVGDPLPPPTMNVLKECRDVIRVEDICTPGSPTQPFRITDPYTFCERWERHTSGCSACPEAGTCAQTRLLPALPYSTQPASRIEYLEAPPPKYLAGAKYLAPKHLEPSHGGTTKGLIELREDTARERALTAHRNRIRGKDICPTCIFSVDGSRCSTRILSYCSTALSMDMLWSALRAVTESTFQYYMTTSDFTRDQIDWIIRNGGLELGPSSDPQMVNLGTRNRNVVLGYIQHRGVRVAAARANRHRARIYPTWAALIAAVPQVETLYAQRTTCTDSISDDLVRLYILSAAQISKSVGWANGRGTKSVYAVGAVGGRVCTTWNCNTYVYSYSSEVHTGSRPEVLHDLLMQSHHIPRYRLPQYRGQ